MPNLFYRAEFFKDETEPSNEGVYLQLRQSPVAADWIDRVRKQDYAGGTSTLADAIFTVAGVTELSIQPFRVWVSKSPIYQWSEVVPPVLGSIKGRLGLSGVEEMFGSPVYLDKSKDRLEP